MCLGGGDKPDPIQPTAPPRTLVQEAPTSPDRTTTDDKDSNSLDSASKRAARGTKKYKTENDLAIGGASAVQAPTGIKV